YLLSGLAFLTLIAGMLVYRSIRELHSLAPPSTRRGAAIVLLAAIVILAFYPTGITQSTPGALFTVIVGAVLLFAPMWALGIALVPYQTEGPWQSSITRFDSLKRYRYHVISVILTGALLGMFLVLGESTEGGAKPHLAGLAFVALVYI